MSGSDTPQWLTRRIALWGAALLAGLAIFLLTYYVIARLTLGAAQAPPPQLGADFINYWLGARFAATGQAAAAYDRELFFSAQQSAIGPGAEYKIYSYPPAAMLLSLPLAAFPFLAGLAIWTLAGWLLASAVLARLVGWPLAALASIGAPAAFLNVLSGQNGFFTAAILAGGLMLLDRSPLLAGLIWGLLAYKPQFALLLPLALLAGGRWRALLAAAAGAVLLIAASAAWCGLDAWIAFLDQMRFQRHLLELPHDDWFRRMPTVFATLRLAGAPLAVASAAQAFSAVAAVLELLWIWRSRASGELKAATLVIATLVASPYAWDYDLVVLLFAVAWLARCGAQRGFLSGEQPLLPALAGLPVFMVAGDLAFGMQTGPVLLWLAMAALLRRALREVRPPALS